MDIDRLIGIELIKFQINSYQMIINLGVSSQQYDLHVISMANGNYPTFQFFYQVTNYCYVLLQIILCTGITFLIQLLYNSHPIHSIQYTFNQDDGKSHDPASMFQDIFMPRTQLLQKKLIYLFTLIERIKKKVKTYFPMIFYISQQLQYFDFYLYFMLVLSSLLYHKCSKNRNCHTHSSVSEVMRNVHSTNIF